jgi:hypothetical protein
VTTVRTEQLVAHADIGFEPVVVLTAAAGVLTVITCISAVTGNNALIAYWNLLHAPSGAKLAGAFHTEGTLDWTQDLLTGRWALEPGDTLTFTSDGSAWDLFITGFTLTLP